MSDSVSENKGAKKRLNKWELLGAGAVVLLGGFIALEAASYPVGTLSEMGPGFVPLALGVLLMILGIGIGIAECRSERKAPVVRFRPLLLIAAGVIAFGVLVERSGLVPATVALVVLSSLAERPVRPLSIVINAIVLSVIGVLVFLKGLGIPLSAFNW